MFISKGNQIFFVTIHYLEQVVQSKGLVDTFWGTFKDIERTSPGIDRKLMLVEGVHVFCQGIFVTGSGLQEDTVRVLGHQFRLELIFRLESFYTK
ncbi:Uncharacterised protein [Mycobacterium tuberculosis]|nr:Uncharacterised protein [Mycobacterium tuberculosis]